MRGFAIIGRGYLGAEVSVLDKPLVIRIANASWREFRPASPSRNIGTDSARHALCSDDSGERDEVGLLADPSARQPPGEQSSPIAGQGSCRHNRVSNVAPATFRTRPPASQNRRVDVQIDVSSKSSIA